MKELKTIIPDVEVLLALEPEELAGKMLTWMVNRGDSKFHFSNITGELWGFGEQNDPYPLNRRDQVELALREAWAWASRSRAAKASVRSRVCRL